ncbi:hypothetical protein [Kitasatospora sp. NPDC047058]|uniref:hypothetical protein n=1 Tax=Kitasatospora sp. NPDC047058 TaxID=3155620 RepID=UPI003403BB6B
MTSAAIAELLRLPGPCLTAAPSAYGSAVITWAEDATANAGRTLPRAIWDRGEPVNHAALEVAVQEATGEDPLAARRQQIMRALHDALTLLPEVITLRTDLTPGGVAITAPGTRALAAHAFGMATTGDHANVTHRPAKPGMGT